MGAHKVHCPACAAPVSTAFGEDGRYWCTSCDQLFEVLDLPDEPPSRPPPLPARRPATRTRSRGPSNRILLVLFVVGLLGATGVGIAAYNTVQKNRQEQAKETLPADPPKKEPDAPKPPAEPVKKVEPVKKEDVTKKEEPPKKVEPVKKDGPAAPTTPTTEEVVRRVKGSAVYIRTPAGSGTGFFAGKPGFVVTNAHVVGYGPREVRRPTKIEVVVASGEADEKTLLATIFGVDMEADLALLRVEGGTAGLPAPLPFGKSSELIETQEVVIFGYPFGEQLGKNISVNRTTISSLRKEGGKLAVVQLAGGVNPGNSGGPVINAKGEVIGVCVAKLRMTDTIAFAIPSDEADAFVKEQERVGGRINMGSSGGSGAGGTPPPAPPGGNNGGMTNPTGKPANAEAKPPGAP